MEISYRDIRVSTDSDMAIKYHQEGTLDDFAGHAIDQFENDAFLPETVGFVSHRFPFLANLNIRDNIILPLEFHRDMSERDAADKVQPYIEHLGIEGILSMRKESVAGYDLLKAMAVRAISMSPELVFFLEPHHFVPLRTFSSFLDTFRLMLGKNANIWIALEEGMNLSWTYDQEVSLDG